MRPIAIPNKAFHIRSPVTEPQQPSKDLQFEQVEAQSGQAPSGACASCGQPLRDVYYDVNGRTLCESCRAKAEASWSSGTSAGRFAKALVFGVAAAAAGTALYYGVLALTGYEVGLIAIVVGFLVGTAVKKGSQGRGGWKYQALAMFLTYTSIVSSYVPLLIQEFSKQGFSSDSTVTTTLGSDTAVVESLLDTAGFAAAVDTAAAITPDPDPPGLGEAVVALVFLLGLLYAIPFLAGFENILGLLIIGIGVYEAWKLNRRAELNVTGPFKVNA